MLEVSNLGESVIRLMSLSFWFWNDVSVPPLRSGLHLSISLPLTLVSSYTRYSLLTRERPRLAGLLSVVR